VWSHARGKDRIQIEHGSHLSTDSSYANIRRKSIVRCDFYDRRRRRSRDRVVLSSTICFKGS
jgi:hypothetical protein